VEVKLVQNEMAFHPLSSVCNFDQVFSGSYDERFQKLQFPPDYHHSFCTYLPNSNNMLSQNIYADYNQMFARNAAYSSLFAEPCHQLPCSNPQLLHNMFQSNAWTSVGSSVATPLSNSNQFININNSLYDSLNMPRSFSLPDPSYHSFSHHLDHEHLAGCNAYLNHQNSDYHTPNSGSFVASCPQMQRYQHPSYLSQGTDTFGTTHHPALPLHYSVDEIMQNTVTSCPPLTGEDIQTSLIDRDNTQQTTFYNCSPPNQLHVLGQNFEVGDRTDMLSESSIIDYSADDAYVNKSISVSHQNLTDIPTVFGTDRVLTDCAVDGCRHNGHADCMASSSCMLSSVSEAHVSSNSDTMSLDADDYLCQAMSEVPQPRKEPVECVPSVSASDRYAVGTEFTCYDRKSASPAQTAVYMSDVGASTSGFEVPLKEDEHITVNDIELDTICAINSALPSELNGADKQVANGQEVVTTQPDVVNCQPVEAFSNTSDDVIVLSPFPIASEPTAVFSVDPGTNTIKSSSIIQLTCIQPNTACDLISAVHPIVSKSLPAVLPHVSSHSLHMISSVANATTCSYIKPVFHHPPITVTCSSLRNGHQYEAHMNREKLRHWTPSAMLDKSLKLRPHNTNLSSNGQCIEIKNLQNSRLQKHVPLMSQAFPRYGVTHRNACRNINSVSTSQISRISSAIRTNLRQTLSTRYMPQFPLYRQGSSTLQLHDASLSKHGTYSITAARIILQRLKQARLSEIASLRAARRQMARDRRLSSVSRTGVSEVPDVIDLTDDTEDSAVETCESIFARTRRRMASSRPLYRPRQTFLGQSYVADGSYCDTECQPEKKAFAVDRSLPFYRCFVRKLLRNFKFSANGVPVTMYPAFPEVMPSAASSHAAKAREPPSTDCSPTYKETVQKGKPLVVLKKLDQSVLNNLKKYGSVKIGTQHSGTYALAASPRIELENCVPLTDASQELQPYASHDKVSAHTSQIAVDAKFDRTKQETDLKETVISKAAAVGCDTQNGVDIYHRQQIAEFDWSEEENNQKENAVIKLMANTRQQHDDLVSLCRPVSVVLERLDETRVYNSSMDLCETKTFHQDRKEIARLETELSDNILNWTISQIPRANRIPIIIISALRSSAPKKTSECCEHCLRKDTSKYLRTRDCTAGSQCVHNFAPHCSKLDTSQSKKLKKMSGSQKLYSARSLSMSLRSSHVRRRSHILMPVTRPASQISSKHGKNHTKSLSKLFVKRAGSGKSKYHSKLMDHLHTVHCGECFTPSGSSAQNNALSGNLLTRDSFFHKHLLNDNVSSTSNTVVSSSTDVMNCLTSKNALMTDLLTYHSVYSEDLQQQEDCPLSDSDTILLSRHSSVDDLTIPYRSPLNLYDSDESSLDQQDWIDGNLEADVNDNKFDRQPLDSDQELRPPSSNLAESCTFSESLDCSLITSYSMDSQRMQPTPVQLIGPVNAKPETQHSVNKSLSEFMDSDQTKNGMAALVSVKVVLEKISTVP